MGANSPFIQQMSLVHRLNATHPSKTYSKVSYVLHVSADIGHHHVFKQLLVETSVLAVFNV
jgi:hypothetical protein